MKAEGAREDPQGGWEGSLCFVLTDSGGGERAGEGGQEEETPRVSREDPPDPSAGGGRGIK